MAHISGQTPQGNCAPVKYLGGGRYQCAPVPEKYFIDKYLLNQWFLWHARVDGEVGETLHIVLNWPAFDRKQSEKMGGTAINSSDTFIRAGSQAVFYSEDQIHWKRIDETRVEGWDILFDVTLGAKTCFLTVNLYYTPAMYDDLRRALAVSPFIERRVIGQAWAGEDIELFVATDPAVPAEEKKIVYLQGAQHAAEYSGPNVLDPMLRYLADGLDEAAELLKKYEFHIVPVLNMSSWLYGLEEHLSVKNPNRDWEELELPEPRAVDAYLRALPKKPVLLLDLHNGWTDDVRDGASVTVMDDLAPSPIYDGQMRFAQMMMEECDYLPPDRVWHNKSSKHIFKGYAQANFGFGFTMEFSRFNIYDRAQGRLVPVSQARYRRFAVQLAKAVDRFVEERC